jgi:hypothetical protein
MACSPTDGFTFLFGRNGMRSSGETWLWRLASARSDEVFNDSPEDQQPPDRSVSLESDGEAFGFGDALGLIRSRDRSDNLRTLGPIDHGLVFELETGCIQELPTEIGLRRATGERAQTVKED